MNVINEEDYLESDQFASSLEESNLDESIQNKLDRKVNRENLQIPTEA